MKRYLKPRNLIWLAAIPLIIIAIRIFPWSEIIAALQSLTLGEITVLIVLNGFILLVFSSRWWFILRACGYRISYVRLSGIRLAGFAISYFSPGTQFGGEPLQAYLVQNKHGVPVSTAIASVTLDKLFEIMANFAFLVTGVILTLKNDLVPGLAPANAGVCISTLLALPLAYFGVLWLRHYPLSWLVTRLPKKIAGRATVQKICSVVTISEKQIAEVVRQKPLLMFWILLLSIFVWLLMIVEYWLMVRFLGAPINLLQAVAGLTAVRLAFLTPLPGGVGLLEAGQVLVMEAFGYSAALGITLSLLIRARDLLIGLASLWAGGFASSRPVGSPDLQSLAPESQGAVNGD